MYISTANPGPNKEEYNLITYLRDQNLTFGFGTYWDANSITYLSGEIVTIRSVFFKPNHLIQRDRLNSCDRWFVDLPDRYFIIYNATRPMDTAQKTFLLEVESGNTSRILHYRDYEIFPMNSS